MDPSNNGNFKILLTKQQFNIWTLWGAAKKQYLGKFYALKIYFRKREITPQSNPENQKSNRINRNYKNSE